MIESNCPKVIINNDQNSDYLVIIWPPSKSAILRQMRDRPSPRRQTHLQRNSSIFNLYLMIALSVFKYPEISEPFPFNVTIA